MERKKSGKAKVKVSVLIGNTILPVGKLFISNNGRHIENNRWYLYRNIGIAVYRDTVWGNTSNRELPICISASGLHGDVDLSIDLRISSDYHADVLIDTPKNGQISMTDTLINISMLESNNVANTKISGLVFNFVRGKDGTYLHTNCHIDDLFDFKQDKA